MTDGQQFFATDKDIHDLLSSAKQRITENVLHDLARDRGLFYSSKESRDTLVERISLLGHDYKDVVGIIDRRESARRGEKTTSVTLDVPLTIDELKEVIAAYRADMPKEDVTSYQRSTTEFVMNLTYDEYDYSKTRLIQRQQREATVEFLQKNGKTFLRIPATDKARAVVDKLKEKIAAKKKQEVPSEEIELTVLNDADERNAFFMMLIQSLPDFNLMTVSRLRVASSIAAQIDDEDGIDLEHEAAVEAEMLSVVQNIALNGQNLMASPIYQDLKARGYYITAVSWRSKQAMDPYTVVQFDAGFEDRQQGKRFRYAVHGALRFQHGAYTKTLRPVEPTEKDMLFSMIEDTARKVLKDLVANKSDKQNKAEKKKIKKAAS
ncbi:hypothetical protein [Methylibium petroleiphilum]|uniref:hypothetical protein n=1 Tax=Methylibium petroleiphilum TaxID=105560 RepID=UPI003D2B3093